jgi:hypothetical protein
VSTLKEDHLHKHPTLVHVVADHRRAALLEDATASAWGVTPEARSRRWQRARWLRRLVEVAADVITRIIEDFEPTPSPRIRPVKRAGS